MSIIVAVLALLCVGLTVGWVLYFARLNAKRKAALLSVVLCLAWGATGYWSGHMVATINGNVYYTSRIKKLLTDTESRLEKEHDASSVAQGVRRLNDALHVTYGRPDLDALIRGEPVEQPK
jgi:hypothetical protein